jgi:hypothetical protein
MNAFNCVEAVAAALFAVLFHAPFATPFVVHSDAICLISYRRTNLASSPANPA